QLQIGRHCQQGDGVRISHLFANVFDRAFTHTFEIRDVSRLKIEYERDVVARRDRRRWRRRRFYSASSCRFTSLTRVAVREWRIEEFDLLWLAIFRDDEIFSLQVGDE